MRAIDLSGSHIGRVVEFDTFVEYSEVELRVKGGLRSVHHNGTGEIELYLTGVKNNTGSQTAYTLLGRDDITVWGLDGERTE